MFKDNSHKEIKLIDFGLASKMKRRVNLQEILGTPIYIAPEVKYFLKRYFLNVIIMKLIFGHQES